MAEAKKEAAGKKGVLGKGRHKSAIKRARQSEKRYARNIAVKSAMKTFVKKVHTALKTGKKADAQKALQEVLPFIAKAKNKGILHPRTAARYTSRLAKAVQAI